MSYQTKEDPRTFKNFYPEPGIRHQVHSAFAHRFLPLLVHQSPRDFGSIFFETIAAGRPMDPDRFIHNVWGYFEKRTGLVPEEPHPERSGLVFRRVTDLSMSLLGIDGKTAFLVRMPQPERIPEAYFVAIVFLTEGAQVRNWPKDLKARVITLEDSELERPDGLARGVLCEWNAQGKHLNYGAVVQASQEAFVRAVTQLLETPDRAPQASFTPPREGADSPAQNPQPHPKSPAA